MTHGTQLALGIVLLWFGGACLFIAFESGNVPALTTGSAGQGPKNVGELASAVATTVQSHEGTTGG